MDSPKQYLPVKELDEQGLVDELQSLINDIDTSCVRDDVSDVWEEVKKIAENLPIHDSERMSDLHSEFAERGLNPKRIFDKKEKEYALRAILFLKGESSFSSSKDEEWKQNFCTSIVKTINTSINYYDPLTPEGIASLNDKKKIQEWKRVNFYIQFLNFATKFCKENSEKISEELKDSIQYLEETLNKAQAIRGELEPFFVDGIPQAASAPAIPILVQIQALEKAFFDSDQTVPTIEVTGPLRRLLSQEERIQKLEDMDFGVDSIQKIARRIALYSAISVESDEDPKDALRTHAESNQKVANQRVRLAQVVLEALRHKEKNLLDDTFNPSLRLLATYVVGSVPFNAKEDKGYLKSAFKELQKIADKKTASETDAPAEPSSSTPEKTTEQKIQELEEEFLTALVSISPDRFREIIDALRVLLPTPQDRVQKLASLTFGTSEELWRKARKVALYINVISESEDANVFSAYPELKEIRKKLAAMLYRAFRNDGAINEEKFAKMDFGYDIWWLAKYLASPYTLKQKLAPNLYAEEGTDIEPDIETERRTVYAILFKIHNGIQLDPVPESSGDTPPDTADKKFVDAFLALGESGVREKWPTLDDDQKKKILVYLWENSSKDTDKNDLINHLLSDGEQRNRTELLIAIFKVCLPADFELMIRDDYINPITLLVVGVLLLQSACAKGSSKMLKGEIQSMIAALKTLSDYEEEKCKALDPKKPADRKHLTDRIAGLKFGANRLLELIRAAGSGENGPQKEVPVLNKIAEQWSTIEKGLATSGSEAEKDESSEAVDIEKNKQELERIFADLTKGLDEEAKKNPWELLAKLKAESPDQMARIVSIVFESLRADSNFFNTLSKPAPTFYYAFFEDYIANNGIDGLALTPTAILEYFAGLFQGIDQYLMQAFPLREGGMTVPQWLDTVRNRRMSPKDEESLVTYSKLALEQLKRIKTIYTRHKDAIENLGILGKNTFEDVIREIDTYIAATQIILGSADSADEKEEGSSKFEYKAGITKPEAIKAQIKTYEDRHKDSMGRSSGFWETIIKEDGAEFASFLQTPNGKKLIIETLASLESDVESLSLKELCCRIEFYKDFSDAGVNLFQTYKKKLKGLRLAVARKIVTQLPTVDLFKKSLEKDVDHINRNKNSFDFLVALSNTIGVYDCEKYLTGKEGDPHRIPIATHENLLALVKEAGAKENEDVDLSNEKVKDRIIELRKQFVTVAKGRGKDVEGKLDPKLVSHLKATQGQKLLLLTLLELEDPSDKLSFKDLYWSVEFYKDFLDKAGQNLFSTFPFAKALKTLQEKIAQKIVKAIGTIEQFDTIIADKKSVGLNEKELEHLLKLAETIGQHLMTDDDKKLGDSKGTYAALLRLVTLTPKPEPAKAPDKTPPPKKESIESTMHSTVQNVRAIFGAASGPSGGLLAPNFRTNQTLGDTLDYLENQTTGTRRRMGQILRGLLGDKVAPAAPATPPATPAPTPPEAEKDKKEKKPEGEKKP